VVVVCRDRRGHLVRFVDPTRRDIRRIQDQRLQCRVFIVNGRPQVRVA
jgi:hypothetical protein